MGGPAEAEAEGLHAQSTSLSLSVALCTITQLPKQVPAKCS